MLRRMERLPFLLSYLEPCVIGGDFNLIRNNSEKNKPGGVDHFSFVFNAIIEHAGLRDLPLNGRKYTWDNNSPEPTFEKLDRVLICPDWEDTYPLAIVNALEREISDHILLDTGDHNLQRLFLDLRMSGC